MAHKLLEKHLPPLREPSLSHELLLFFRHEAYARLGLPQLVLENGKWRASGLPCANDRAAADPMIFSWMLEPRTKHHE